MRRQAPYTVRGMGRRYAWRSKAERRIGEALTQPTVRVLKPSGSATSAVAKDSSSSEGVSISSEQTTRCD
jgi:hypothetical protein